MKPAYKTALIWAGLLAAFVIGWRLLLMEPRAKPIPFFEFRTQVHEGKVQQATINLKKKTYTFSTRTKEGVPDWYRTVGPVDEQLRTELEDAGVRLTFEGGEEGGWTSLLFTWLPILVLIGLFIFFMRQIQAGSGRAMSFGKSRARMLAARSNKTTFRDVAGIDEVLEELEEVISFARAIAGEANVPFFSISGSDFVEMFVGVGASRVRDLFEQAKKNSPCIVFIDEIDAVGRQRGAGIGGGHDEREQTLNQLLIEMDGFEPNDNVIVIAATNRPDVLDPAILRAGRFDRRVVVHRPDIRGRQAILGLHAKRVPLEEDVDLAVVARGTAGFSGADLETIVNEAAIMAARRDAKLVSRQDFDLAKDKLLMGTERRSMVISDAEKRTTAYHEAGHTIAARFLPNTDPVHKVTIIPRGQSMGSTQQLPEEDRHYLSREVAFSRIAVLLAGRSAEEVFLSQQTTGAGNDLEQATELARKMIREWGMSERLGPLAYGSREEAIFLGREIAQHQEYSEKTAIIIDEEVHDLVIDALARSRAVLEEHAEDVRRLAAAMLVQETLDLPEPVRSGPRAAPYPGEALPARHWKTLLRLLQALRHGHPERDARLVPRWRPLPREGRCHRQGRCHDRRWRRHR